MKKTNMRTQATQTDVKRQREQQLLQLQQINQMRRTNSGQRKVRLRSKFGNVTFCGKKM